MVTDHYEAVQEGAAWTVVHVLKNFGQVRHTRDVCMVQAGGERGQEQAERIALCLNQLAAYSSEAIRERGVELKVPATV